MPTSKLVKKTKMTRLYCTHQLKIFQAGKIIVSDSGTLATAIYLGLLVISFM